jgi:plastocyanin
MTVQVSRRSAALCVALGSIALAATACGSSGSTTTTAGTTTAGTTTQSPSAQQQSGTTLHLATDPNALAFVPTTLTAPAGKVTLVLTDDSAIQHSIAIKAAGDVPGQIVNQGEMSTTTATLAPGTYQYYCTVPGHAAAGMVGTLTVTG